jgi:hypothetical protein
MARSTGMTSPGRGASPCASWSGSLQAPEPAESRWRLMVAGDMQRGIAAVDRFTGVLAASLGGLGVLLALAALAQVAVGLAPLKTMQQALQRVREGRQQRLEGRFPPRCSR